MGSSHRHDAGVCPEVGLSRQSGPYITLDLSILHVSKQLNAEASQVLLRSNEFVFREPLALATFSSGLQTEQRNNIRHVYICEPSGGWPSSDWPSWKDYECFRRLGPLHTLTIDMTWVIARNHFVITPLEDAYGMSWLRNLRPRNVDIIFTPWYLSES